MAPYRPIPNDLSEYKKWSFMRFLGTNLLFFLEGIYHFVAIPSKYIGSKFFSKGMLEGIQRIGVGALTIMFAPIYLPVLFFWYIGCKKRGYTMVFNNELHDYLPEKYLIVPIIGDKTDFLVCSIFCVAFESLIGGLFLVLT